ncbi:YceI family protein [Pseudorhodoferax sp.]|uniref:YceI family protein n=1 Tax=Pseudorhodoferax sp. TaxID=1993553 RepID=UPI002DD67085|nr:YceI family protein [Pseudorhodoferax sp.]
MRRPSATRLLNRRRGVAALLLCCCAAWPAHAQLPPAAGPAPEMAARPGGPPQPGGRYVVDPTHTFVLYEMGHYGTSTNRGRFGTRDGQVQIDAAGALARVDVTIDMASINTGVDLLNRHVQSSDFLNVADHPTARYTADAVRIEDGQVRALQGHLTLLGQAHPVTLRAVRFNCYVSPLHGRQVCGGDFETEILRSQWGITWGLQFGFEDRVRLLVQIEAVLVPAPTPR